MRTCDISIILPVYNAERVIENTLKNLSNQTFGNFEVVIINDGSFDNTVNIIEVFCNIDHRFKLLNKKNEGVASARNLGLQNVIGDYLIQFDADDEIPLNALEILYNEARKSNAEVVLGDFSIIYSNRRKTIHHNFSGDYIELLNGLLSNKYHGALWNKLIKRQLCSDLSFTHGINYMEDKLFLVKLLVRKPKIAYTAGIVYHYIQRDDSITSSLSDNSYSNIFDVIVEIETILKNNLIDVDLTQQKLTYRLLGILNNKKVDHVNTFIEANEKIFNVSNLSIHYKVLLYLETKGISILSVLYRMIKK